MLVSVVSSEWITSLMRDFPMPSILIKCMVGHCKAIASLLRSIPAAVSLFTCPTLKLDSNYHLITLDPMDMTRSTCCPLFP